MEPFFNSKDTKMFYKYLHQCSNYFEFGSGGSTYQASICSSVQNIYTVESDNTWIKKIKEKITENRVHFLPIDIDTTPGNWGHPGPNCSNDRKKKYSDTIKEFKNIDLVLIDGRFRVACCLKVHKFTNNETIVLFDDFLIREHYHVVLDYYDIIEQTSDNSMVALKKKTKVVPDELIQKYEIIAD